MKLYAILHSCLKDKKLKILKQNKYISLIKTNIKKNQFYLMEDEELQKGYNPYGGYTVNNEPVIKPDNMVQILNNMEHDIQLLKEQYTQLLKKYNKEKKHKKKKL